MGSFYVDRLHRFFEDAQWDQIVEDKLDQGSIGCWVNNKRVGAVNTRLLARNYHEETYKGFQIVTIEWVRHVNAILDKNGVQFNTTGFKPSEIGGYGDLNVFTDYASFAYKIGDPSDQIAKVNWSYQYSFLKGIGVANSLDLTLKKAKKRLDLYAKLFDVKSDLEELVHVQISRSQAQVPYNAKIGDQVFVQGHGRLRKGIVIDTTSNKFIVGYLTPTNKTDFHWKTLPLSDLYV